MPFASAADAEAHAVELFILYKHSLSLCKGLDPKEKAPGDDLISIAVASLMAARNLDQAEVASSQDGGQSSMELERLVQKRMLQVCSCIFLLLVHFLQNLCDSFALGYFDRGVY